jgi:PBP1b-binding outer membrane lipoprotein LpoB|tara:strand:+ start:3824 stop:4021 length:198 start_codon:yes stop_codon:yes gene_type:complete
MKTSTKIIIIALIVILAFAGWKYYTSKNSVTKSTVTKSVPVNETPDIKTPVMKPDPIDTAITGGE